MSRWNETTVEILRLLSESPKTVGQLFEIMECSRSNVTVPILKLYKKGLVDRNVVEQGSPVILKNPGKGSRAVKRARLVFVYNVTEEGLRKMETMGEDNR